MFFENLLLSFAVEVAVLTYHNILALVWMLGLITKKLWPASNDGKALIRFEKIRHHGFPQKHSI